MKEFAKITDSFYSLIRPEPHYYKWFCQRVHGLGPKDTEKAPVFPEVWEKIERCLPNHQLHTVAAACGYDLVNHHHALADAQACAAIAMKLFQNL